MSDPRNSVPKPHGVSQVRGECLAESGHTAVHPLLVESAVVRDHRLQAWAGVDLPQPLQQRRIWGHRPESRLVDLPEPRLRPARA